MFSTLPSAPRALLAQALNFALVLSTAFMLWKGLSIATNSPSPIVVVLSGSMEPAFQRGDILFLWNRPWSWPARFFGVGGGGDGEETVVGGIRTEGILSKEDARTGKGERDGRRRRRSSGKVGGLFAWETGRETAVGEIVVYNVRGKDIPIVHRVVRTFGGGDQPLRLLTKGDNNLADDTELYARGQDYLDREADVIGSVVGYIPFVGYVTILLSEHPWVKTAMLGLTGVMVVLQRE